MFENLKNFFSKDNRAQTTRSVRVMEVADYDADFQIVQGEDLAWSFYIEIYPMESDEKLLSEDQFVEGLGTIELVENVEGIIIPGKERYLEWEYAAETAIDIIELMGFEIYTGPHNFEVSFWDAIRQREEKKIGVFDGENFSISPDYPVIEG